MSSESTEPGKIEAKKAAEPTESTAPEKRIHPRDPLHGITLETIVKYLVQKYGWKEMADRIPVRCFMFNPDVKSSLKFLRATPWARKKIEIWYLMDIAQTPN